jgi:hypothetical protein
MANLKWQGVVALGLIVAGAVAAAFFDAQELALVLAGAVAGRLALPGVRRERP